MTRFKLASLIVALFCCACSKQERQATTTPEAPLRNSAGREIVATWNSGITEMSRTPVPGGWLYVTEGFQSIASSFVPDVNAPQPPAKK